MMKSQSAVLLLVVVLAVTVCHGGKLLFTSKDDAICPDSTSSCDVQSTCCPTANGHWACCPQKNAQCCSDGVHCCPSGTICNNERGTCDQVVNNITRPAVRKSPEQTSSPSFGKTNVGMTCGDHHSQCTGAGAACCRHSSGGYSCCNYPMNVCCEDGLHCCHSGTVCDILHLVCVPYPSTVQESHPWNEMIPARDRSNELSGTDEQKPSEAVAASDAKDSVDEKANFVHCPDGSLCYDGQTCCRTASGYGCCNYYLATCCSDLLHCCPHGYRCSGGVCYQAQGQAPWATITNNHP